MRSNRARHEELISQDTRLPAQPSALPLLLQAVSDNDIDHRKLALVIERCPSIAARLISLANSAWSAPRTPVTSLDRACTQLGLRLVRSVSISLAVSAPFNPMRCPSFDPQRFWSSAFLVADGAAWLSACAQNVTGLDPKSVQTAGLLHNLSLLWLADNKPQESAQALDAASADDTVCVNEAFRQMAQTNVYEVGGHLGRAWALPEVLVAAMEHHDDPGYGGVGWETAALVGSAAAMVAALHRGVECLPEEEGSDNLQINRTDREQVFKRMADKFEQTRELVQTLSLS